MIVTDTFPPDINGVARTLQTLAKGLAKRGHSVQVVTTTDGASSDNKSHGVDVHSIYSVPLPGYQGLRMGLTSRRNIKALIDADKPDALYVAVETIMGVNAIRAARDSGIGIVSGFHTNFHSYTKNYRVPILMNLMARYLRFVHNRTARTLTPSETTAEQLRAMGVNNVGVMGRGVDTELFSPERRDPALRREWGVADDCPVAIFVGRIAAEKNLPLVVRSFQQIMATTPGARCVFVGDGPLSKWLKETHPEFIHAGARTGEDLARHYASADIFVFPSLTETFGNVLLEAMASRLVTISFDYAASQQFVRHGENGFKATLDDEEGFLRAVEEAVIHSNDAGLRDAAHATAQRLSWDAIISQFEQELIAASNGAHPIPATQQQP